MARPQLDFYFDYISHNAYLAWTQIEALAARHELELVARPVLFGALLKANGQLGPAEIPAKSRWMLRDVVRKALSLGVPIAPPASHPFNPLYALRVTHAAANSEYFEKIIAALFKAAWVDSLDVTSPAVLETVLQDLGVDAKSLLERASSDEIKARLRGATETAIASGVFGVPSMVVDRQVFWGFDDLPHLEASRRGEDRVADHDLSAWWAVRPSITRKR